MVGLIEEVEVDLWTCETTFVRDKASSFQRFTLEIHTPFNAQSRHWTTILRVLLPF